MERKQVYAEGRPLDEQDLIAQAKNGQLAAYEELVRRHEEVAFRIAYLTLNDATEAKDVAQEAFVKAYRALSGFGHGRPFRPWLARIVVNEARNARKATQRRRALAQRYAETVHPANAAPSAELAALRGERRRLLIEAVGQLKDADQVVIHMRYFLEFSETEMAAALRCRPGTVWSRISRASRRLKALIESRFPELSEDYEGVRS